MEEQQASSSRVYPVGFRFCPTEVELIVDYLQNKIQSKKLPCDYCVRETNIYDSKPEDIINMLNLWGEKEWYFFTPRDRKYPNGSRPNRRAGVGYWKATGGITKIKDENAKEVGTKRSLVYYEGEAPKETKTNWIMHEYCAADIQFKPAAISTVNKRLDNWVLCKIKNNKRKAEDKKANCNHPDRDREDLAAAAAPMVQVKRQKNQVQELTEEISMEDPTFCSDPPHLSPLPAGIYSSSSMSVGYGSSTPLQFEFPDGNNNQVFDNIIPLDYKMPDYYDASCDPPYLTHPVFSSETHKSGHNGLNHHDKQLLENSSQYLSQDQALPGNFSSSMMDGNRSTPLQFEFTEGDYITIDDIPMIGTEPMDFTTPNLSFPGFSSETQTVNKGQLENSSYLPQEISTVNFSCIPGMMEILFGADP